ncbi:RNA-binding protein nanos [Haematobia irritans]|uniref:RNA-binding protein nanos n=1 Tax=Haematobia irritans TaxID=7368 RepID=UPI003F4FE1B2
MYRSSPETKKQPEMLNNFFGLNSHGLHMKCFQEMYLDTCSKLVEASANISPTSSMMESSSQSSSSQSSLSPTSTASLSPPSRQQQQQQLPVGGNLGGSGMSENLQQQQHDEISKSLQMFAMLTAYSNGNEPTAGIEVPQLPNSPVEAVMQDFACNGYICDELNRYHLGIHLSNAAAACGGNNLSAGQSTSGLLAAAVNQPYNGVNPLTSSALSFTPQQLQQLQQLQQHNINLNFNNNFWKMLPTHLQQQNAAAAAAVNMDYNCNQNKKIPKRYNNGSKNEKYTSAKHCVFCENNNEPEAVVKSHAVRDSLGRVLCPKLRTYICPICKASGDKAHTVKYCPQKPIITMEDAVNAESFRLSKGTYYKQQMKV